MKRLFKEPLLHFMFIGAALFWLFHVVSGHRGGGRRDDRRIVINDATVAMLVQRHQSVWQRPPTTEELQGLLDTQVREEILYRNGRELGLERDDAVIRRRVILKLDVITGESTASSAPGEAELEAYLQQHAARYERPAGIAFDQVLFDPMQHGKQLGAELAAALARLRAGADPATNGDSSLLPAKIDSTSTDLIAREFGEEFTQAVSALPVGDWQEPVTSGYGLHLVRVTSRTPGQPATLASVRAAVERDWENDRRQQAKESYYQKLRAGYDIVLEGSLTNSVKARGGRK